LPKDNDTETGEAEDPRTNLVNQLIEYKQMKEAAKEMSVISEEQKFVLYRKLFDEDRKLAKDSREPQYKESNVFDLLAALRKAIKRSEVNLKPHIIERNVISVEECSQNLLNTLKQQKRISFMEILKKETKPVIVITFIAILELIKMGKIFVLQSQNFDDIIITEKPALNLN